MQGLRYTLKYWTPKLTNAAEATKQAKQMAVFVCLVRGGRGVARPAGFLLRPNEKKKKCDGLMMAYFVIT